MHSLSTWNPSWWQLCFSKDASSSTALSIVLPHVKPQAHLKPPDCVVFLGGSGGFRSSVRFARSAPSTS
uniref:GG11322 n=1 Tax=Drosophila erecta TaxID=7220 RepID=B3P276_DROER